MSEWRSSFPPFDNIISSLFVQRLPPFPIFSHQSFFTLTATAPDGHVEGDDDDDNDNDDDNCVETRERHVRVSCVCGYLFIRPRISYLPHICFLRVEAPRALLELENASFMTPSHTPSFPFRSSGMFTQTLSST